MHTGRGQNGDAATHQRLLALMAKTAAFAHLIVAGQHQHTAMRRCPGHAHVLDRIDAAIDPGPLAVPDRKDTVQVGLVGHHDMLRTTHRGHREVFVETGIEMDTAISDRVSRLPDRAVESANRAAPIAADITPGV